MKKKAPLPEGETWFVFSVERPVLGYGVTQYMAYSAFESEKKQKQLCAESFDADYNDLVSLSNEIRFYSSVDLNVGDRFVVFGSRETLGTIDADVIRVGLTELVKLMVTECSRWQNKWPWRPAS